MSAVRFPQAIHEYMNSEMNRLARLFTKMMNKAARRRLDGRIVYIVVRAFEQSLAENLSAAYGPELVSLLQQEAFEKRTSFRMQATFISADSLGR